LEVVVKAIYLLNFYSGSSCAQLQCELFQGCGAVVKMTQIRSSYFHKHGSSSGALSFHECGSGLCLFSHLNILIVSACLKLNGRWIKSSTQN